MATRYCFRCGRDTLWREEVCTECRHGPYLTASPPRGEPYVTTVPWPEGTGSKIEYGTSGCRHTLARIREED